MERCDDSYGVIGELAREALLTYATLPHGPAGIAREDWCEDLCELLAWEDWGLLHRHETRPFAQLSGELAAHAERFILSLACEHPLHHEADQTVANVAYLHIAGGRLTRFVPGAAQLGSDFWMPIVALAQAAIKPGPHDRARRLRCGRPAGRAAGLPAAPVHRSDRRPTSGAVASATVMRTGSVPGAIAVPDRLESVTTFALPEQWRTRPRRGLAHPPRPDRAQSLGLVRTRTSTDVSLPRPRITSNQAGTSGPARASGSRPGSAGSSVGARAASATSRSSRPDRSAQRRLSVPPRSERHPRASSLGRSGATGATSVGESCFAYVTASSRSGDARSTQEASLLPDHGTLMHSAYGQEFAKR
jgi:hypothetical protein